MFRLAPLSPDHIPAILAIEAVSNGAPWSEQAFVNELTNPQSLFRVALENGEVVGYGGIWMCIDEAHVTTLATHPDHRRKGIGRRLMVDLLQESKKLGMVCSTLEVRKSNEAAIKLYENLGFQSVSVRKGYYPDNKEDAVIMWMYELDTWTP